MNQKNQYKDQLQARESIENFVKSGDSIGRAFGECPVGSVKILPYVKYLYSQC